MALLGLFWLSVALIVFMLLHRQSLRVRLLVAALVFIVLSGVSLYFIYRSAGEPLGDSVPVSKEILERQGKMTREEWEAYQDSISQEDQSKDPE